MLLLLWVQFSFFYFVAAIVSVLQVVSIFREYLSRKVNKTAVHATLGGAQLVMREESPPAKRGIQNKNVLSYVILDPVQETKQILSEATVTSLLGE